MAERPVLVTSDEQVIDELSRLAAVAGVELSVFPDPVAARAAWSAAPLVLVGGDVAGSPSTMPRRARVVLVADGQLAAGSGVWQDAVALGAEHVAVLPEAEDWLVEALAAAAEAADGRCVAVVGGRGGAGASTLAGALAVTAAREGRRVLLVDGDPLGGGLDLLFGEEDAPGLRWPDLAGASGRVSGRSLQEALPRVGELTLLSWDRGDRLVVPAPAMGALLDAGLRASDLVVVDLPRQVEDATAVALQRADTVLLVVPAELRAAAAAGRIAAAVAAHCDDVRVIVRDPGGALDADAVAASLRLPLAGALRSEGCVARGVERGEVPGERRRGALAALCRRLLAELVPRPSGGCG